MATANLELTFSCGGLTVTKSISRSADHPNPYGPVTLPAGYPLTSWVKTDADTAAGNLAGGHGQTSGTYDVYWTGGRRYGVTGTVTVNALALDGGSGTDFPASANTSVVVCKQVQINTAIDGDAAAIACVSFEFDATDTSKGQVTFKDTNAAVIAHLDLTGNEPQVIDITGGASNVFTGNPITVAYASNGSTANAASLKIITLEDSTP